jgi:hypothetical protein
MIDEHAHKYKKIIIMTINDELYQKKFSDNKNIIISNFNESLIDKILDVQLKYIDIYNDHKILIIADDCQYGDNLNKILFNARAYNINVWNATQYQTDEQKNMYDLVENVEKIDYFKKQERKNIGIN